MTRRGAAIRVAIAAAFGLTAAIGVATAGHPQSSVAATDEISRVLNSVRQRPTYTTRHSYVMSARIRFLLFWKTAEDVGGGYIERSSNADNSSRSIQVLFGSDPKKAPRSINRWGAAVERVDGGGTEGRTSTVFGFMKTSKGKDAAEMEKELAKEKDGGQYYFDAILGEARKGQSVARVANFASPVDFDFNDYEKASREAASRLQALKKDPRKLTLDSKTCTETRSFLFAVEELGRAALDGKRAPISTCYVYNSRAYTLTLQDISKVSEHKVKVNLRGSKKPLEKRYTSLVQTEFETRNHETGDESSFEVLFGTSGEWRGVPVQIRHQPNFWFQIVLDLI